METPDADAPESTLLYDVDADGVCTITLNRPDKLNAINGRVLSDLQRAFRRARTDDAVRGVILTGSGDRAFAAGADIGQFAGLDAINGHRFALRGQAVLSAIEAMAKPVVAAVNGFALGGGCELALACHLRVASETAQFGLPEVSLGLIPGYGGTQRLPRVVGRGIATEMILTGDRIPAQRAYEVGLVNRVTAADALLPTARELVLSIASKAPVAVAMALQAIRATDLPQPQGLQTEAALFGQVCATQDFEEGISAFLNKRKPEFEGR
jgi:enoyl-CoA hydratase